MLGMIELLLGTGLTPEQKEFAEIASSSGRLLLTIVNDILDFSKLDAGKVVFEQIDFDLAATIEGTLESFAERAHSKGVELLLDLSGDLPLRVCGDSNRLRQVLNNLIGNALKFTAVGEVIVRASLEAESPQLVTIQSEIRDTGIGISSSAQAGLFTPFSQADASIARMYGGSGLGLAISAKLVEGMSGKIAIESKIGEGSTVRFTAAFGRVMAAAVASPSKLNRLEGLRAIVADDNRSSREIICRLLRSWSIVAEEAANGEAALLAIRRRAVENQPYDLAILDAELSGRDCMVVAEEIRSDPILRHLRLILMGRVGDKSHDSTVWKRCFHGWVTKPVRPSNLFDRISTIFETATTESQPEKESPPQSNPSPTVAQPAPQILGQSHILVVDDNPVNRKIAQLQLQTMGYVADTVSGGRAALEAMARTPYSIVLMDCEMPEMDGYLTTAEIRSHEGSDRHTRIIAMTAHVLEGARARCLNAGMDDYLSKPVTQKALAAALERARDADRSQVLR
jgi:CheY-like chemotaxis protein